MQLSARSSAHTCRPQSVIETRGNACRKVGRKGMNNNENCKKSSTKCIKKPYFQIALSYAASATRGGETGEKEYDILPEQ